MTRRLMFIALTLFLSLALAACGGSADTPSGGSGSSTSGPITLADVPTFAGATELKPGENPIADTLVQNNQQAAAMGTDIDQKSFTLPADASWDSIKAFYAKELEGAGWKAQAIPGAAANPMVSMSIWLRGTQSLTVMMLTEPINSDKFLLYSLATN